MENSVSARVRPPMTLVCAHLCWLGVLVVGFVNLVLSGGTPSAGADFGLALACLGNICAAQARGGKKGGSRAGRVAATVVGVIVAAWCVFDLIVLQQSSSLIASGSSLAVAVLLNLLDLGLVVTGTALMFAPTANAYLSQRRPPNHL